DLRPVTPREQRGGATDRPRLRRVRVEDVRAKAADQAENLPGGEDVGERIDVAVKVAYVPEPDAPLACDVLHRSFVGSDATGGEQGLVAALLELGREVTDVEGRPTDVQAGDQAEDADGLVRHGAERSPMRQPSRAGARSAVVARRSKNRSAIEACSGSP